MRHTLPSERFEDQGEHKVKAHPLHEKQPTGSAQNLGMYGPEDFRVGEDQSHCNFHRDQQRHRLGVYL